MSRLGDKIKRIVRKIAKDFYEPKQGFHDEILRQLHLRGEDSGFESEKDSYIKYRDWCNDAKNKFEKGFIDVAWRRKGKKEPYVAIEVDSSRRKKSLWKLLHCGARIRIWIYYGEKDLFETICDLECHIAPNRRQLFWDHINHIEYILLDDLEFAEDEEEESLRGLMRRSKRPPRRLGEKNPDIFRKGEKKSSGRKKSCVVCTQPRCANRACKGQRYCKDHLL